MLRKSKKAVKPSVIEDKTTSSEEKNSSEENICPHTHTEMEDNGETCCVNCGEIIDVISFKQDWKGSESNASRCQYITGNTEKGNLDPIFNSIKLSLTSSQKQDVIKRYKKIVGDKTLRGNTRKSIVAACVMFSFRNEGNSNVVTQENLCEIFKIEKKQLSEAISKHTLVFPESRVQTIQEDDLLEVLLNKCYESLNISLEEYEDEIKEMRDFLTKKDRNFKHTNPKNSISTLIFYIIQKYKLKKISRTEFSKKTEQAEASISKLLKIVQSYYKDD